LEKGYPVTFFRGCKAMPVKPAKIVKPGKTGAHLVKPQIQNAAAIALHDIRIKQDWLKPLTDNIRHIFTPTPLFYRKRLKWKVEEAGYVPIFTQTMIIENSAP
jgi:hypothetical protein